MDDEAGRDGLGADWDVCQCQPDECVCRGDGDVLADDATGVGGLPATAYWRGYIGEPTHGGGSWLDQLGPNWQRGYGVYHDGCADLHDGADQPVKPDDRGWFTR